MDARRVTIKDIAMAIGVTPQTVSRVFRGKGYVSADTRARVLDAAQTIFVNSHTINESVYREALSLGASAVISFLEPEPSLDGIVSDMGVPLMILGRRTELASLDYITTDDVMGGALAAERLVASGCKSFAYLAYAFGMTCVQDRFKGFSERLAKDGYTAEIIDVTYGIKSALAERAAAGQLPDGLFCFSDMMAYDAIKTVNAMQASVKIVGYDNIQADISMPIDLTTIGVDKPEYVQSVVSALLAKVEGESDGRIANTFEVKLHDGETA